MRAHQSSRTTNQTAVAVPAPAATASATSSKTTQRSFNVSMVQLNVRLLTFMSAGDPCLTAAAMEIPCRNAQQNFDQYCSDHQLEIDLLNFASPQNGNVKRRSWDMLRRLLDKHFDVSIPSLAVMRENLQAAGSPLESEIDTHTYDVDDAVLAEKLPVPQCKWESSRCAPVRPIVCCGLNGDKMWWPSGCQMF